MYQLYIASKNYSSWSLRPWILLRVLNIPFEEKLYLFEDDNRATFRQFSPTGKVPCLQADALTVWDSLAITEYVAEQYPAVWPADKTARAWARCAAAEMHSGFATLRNMCSMNCSIRVQLHEVPQALQRDIDRIDELWREGLTRFGGPFLAGSQFSAADAFFAPVAFRVAGYGLQLSEASQAYVQRLLDLPAMQEWALAGRQEPVHDLHERDCLQYGSLITDVRTAGRAAVQGVAP